MTLTWKTIHLPAKFPSFSLRGILNSDEMPGHMSADITASTAADLEEELALQIPDDVSVEIDEKTSTSPPVSVSAVTMDREDHHVALSVIYCFSFLVMEVGKQCSSYAMKYYNDDVYPVPQTFLVAAVELIKLVVMVTVLLFQGKLLQIRISLWFALPSIVYGITNNIHFYALHLTSPPVWAILMQMRVVFIAVTYRTLFKRQIERIQWFALCVLITGIAITKIGGGLEKGNFIHPMAWLLAAFTSFLCMVAAVLTEYLFKNDRRSFADQQLQLYLFGTIVTLMLCLTESNTKVKDLLQFKGISDTMVLVFVISCVTLSVTSGLAVALIMKKMDNIVKIYCGALATLLTAVVSSIFFSARFQLDWTYAAGFVLVFTAIFLYEKKNVDWKKTTIAK
ncbi:CMP-sialic acid transporter 2 [Lingula anatina]|uniref:CMP-sialic acid transporter 2 n=1 Tax=Lingula anatina TaxID=7574 RepID=A0A1S3JFL9_LINAN|nr:CMP-sialic acid transporter 2 [Lingula anatina]|eukprot:XP_013409202.1 CMP-sialic acid transporter 2 [Lingula anatina]